MANEFCSSDLTAGQLNAIVKKLGGHEGALKFLRGELVVRAPASPNVGLFQMEAQWGDRRVRLEGLLKESAEKHGKTAKGTYEYYKANPDQIPEDWKGKNVFFSDSEFRDAGGNRSVHYVCWDGSAWDWDFGWVELGLVSDDFVAVPASP